VNNVKFFMKISERRAKLLYDFFANSLIQSSIFFDKIEQVSSVAVLEDQIVIILVPIFSNQLSDIRVICIHESHHLIHYSIEMTLGRGFSFELLHRKALSIFHVNSVDFIKASRPQKQLLHMSWA